MAPSLAAEFETEKRHNERLGVNARREINRTYQNHRLYIEAASEI